MSVGRSVGPSVTLCFLAAYSAWSRSSHACLIDGANVVDGMNVKDGANVISRVSPPPPVSIPTYGARRRISADRLSNVDAESKILVCR